MKKITIIFFIIFFSYFILPNEEKTIISSAKSEHKTSFTPLESSSIITTSHCEDLSLSENLVSDSQFFTKEIIRFTQDSKFHDSLDLFSMKLKLNPFKVRSIAHSNSETINFEQLDKLTKLKKVYTAIQQSTLIDLVNSGEISKDITFTKQGNKLSLIGVVISSYSNDKNNLINELLNIGVIATLNDSILSIKDITSIDLIIKIIENSDTKLDATFYMNNHYQSFLTVAIKYRKTELIHELLKRDYNAQPDHIAYTALDYAVRNYSDYEYNRFLEIFSPLLDTPNFNNKKTYQFLEKQMLQSGFPLREVHFKNISKDQKDEVDKFIESLTYALIKRNIDVENVQCSKLYVKAVKQYMKRLIKVNSINTTNQTELAKHSKWAIEVERLAQEKQVPPHTLLNSFDSFDEKKAVHKHLTIKAQQIAYEMQKANAEGELLQNEQLISIKALIEKKKWSKVKSILIENIDNYDDIFLQSLYSLLLQHDSPNDNYEIISSYGVKPQNGLSLLIIYKNDPKLIQFFEKHGMTFNIKDVNGYSPLMNSIKVNAFDSFNYLCKKYGIQQNEKGFDALDVALLKLKTVRESESSNYNFSYINELMNSNVQVKKSHKEIVGELAKSNLILYFSLAERYPDLL